MKTFDTKTITSYLAALVVVIFFLFVHEAYVTRAHPDAPFMDTLRLVYQLEQWLLGGMSFFELWSQGGQHQGFIFQLLLLANVKFYSLDILLANRATGVAVAMFTAIVLFSFLFAAKRYGNIRILTGIAAQFLMCALITGICFSWAGFELFTLDLGLPLWTKNILFMIYFVLHARYMHADSGRQSTLLYGFCLILMGPAIVLIAAMGWSYSFVASIALVSAVSLVESRKQGDLWRQLARCAPLIALFLAQMVYVATSIGGVRSADHSSYASLIQVPDLLLYALGSGVVGLETVQSHAISLRIPELIGAGMLVSAFVLGCTRFWHRVILMQGSLIPLYLLAYGFFTALSVSVARGHAGPAEVMASRYYMDIMLFCVGLLWLWYENLALLEVKGFSISAIGFSVMCVIVIAGQGLTYAREWGAAPYRAMAFKRMNVALSEGVPDQAAAALLQSPLDNARLGDQALREHHLALYSDVHPNSCDAASVQLLSGWYERESQGTWMGKDATIKVPDCRCDFIAKVYLPPNFSTRTLKIQDAGASRTIDLMPGKVEQISLGTAIAPRQIGLSVSETTTPAEISSTSPDVRSLGVDMTGYWYDCKASVSSTPAR